MNRLSFVAALLGSLTVLGNTDTAQASHRGCEYGYSIGPVISPTIAPGTRYRTRYRYNDRDDRSLMSANPVRRYRYDDPPYGLGNFYRDRQGFFFYGRDDRYRFGIHR